MDVAGARVTHSVAIGPATFHTSNHLPNRPGFTMQTLRTTLLTLLLLAAAVPAAALQRDASAIGVPGIESAAQGAAETRQGNCLSLSQAVEQARRQHNGRIVSAETRVQGGREVHVIKVLTNDGKVKTVRVPGCRVG